MNARSVLASTSDKIPVDARLLVAYIVPGSPVVHLVQANCSELDIAQLASSIMAASASRGG